MIFKFASYSRFFLHVDEIDMNDTRASQISFFTNYKNIFFTAIIIPYSTDIKAVLI